MNERDFLGHSKLLRNHFSGFCITQDFTSSDCTSGDITICYVHKFTTAKDLLVPGVLIGGKCFTQSLMLPNLPKDHHHTMIHNSFDYAKLHDSQFSSDCATTVASALDLYLLQAHKDLQARLPGVPQSWKDTIALNALVNKSVPVHAIKTKTEKLLWHQCLGHPCDWYLYNAHKFIDGVPKFTCESDVLSTCPNSVISKQAKSSPGSNPTRVATQLYQGLSIDFSFAGVASKNSKRRLD